MQDARFLPKPKPLGDSGPGPLTIRAFIRRHRADIDAAIRAACPNLGKLNDEDRADWIANDEGLYLWAKREGVEV